MPQINKSVGTAPVLIFTPQTYAQSAIINNLGNVQVYLGQTGVTAATGFPIGPGQEIDLAQVNRPIYAVAAPPTVKAPTGTTNNTISQGGTAVPVASGGASFTQGTALVLVDGNNTEVVTVGAGSTGTSIVISAAAFAHASGISIGQLSVSQNGVLGVQAGA